MQSMPHRQVHLDFHTSEHIRDIGVRFDGDQFAQTLRDAGVQSVVLFAKCHHGWFYTDTEVGERHPQLAFDLLRAQVDACAAHGITTPIYISVGWDERAARLQPGWRRILPDGGFHMMLGKNLQPYWSYLCLNTPYLDAIEAQIRETLRRFPSVNSLWLDIIRQEQCCCNFCRADMDAQGLDWTVEADRLNHARQVFERYLKRAQAAADAVRPNVALFQNTSMVPRGDRAFYKALGHVEVEAVPTGGWGYDHFPISARYLDSWCTDFMGVTVRFHLVWGELQALKHPNALRAEAAIMLAHGAKICIGDHLDPTGVLDPDAYAMIQPVFAEMAAKAPFLARSRPVSDVGLLSSVAVREPGSVRRDLRHIPEDDGAVRVLTQGHVQFDVLDLHSDFSAYRALVLPDRVRLTPALAERLAVYVASGGGLLMTAESGLSVDASRFALDVGAQLLGPSPFEPVFAAFSPSIAADYTRGSVALMAKSLRIRAKGGESLGQVFEPRLQRSARAFCSHIYAPPEEQPSGFDIGVQRGQVVYLAAPLFTLYRRLGNASLRDVTLKALALALGRQPLIRTQAPKGAIVTMRERPDGARVVQLVYAPRELRGDSLLGPIEVIEDLPRLTGIAVDLEMARSVRSVTVQPDDRSLPFEQTGDRVQFTLDWLEGHALIVVEP
jgi:hypothetical protein